MMGKGQVPPRAYCRSCGELLRSWASGALCSKCLADVQVPTSESLRARQVEAAAVRATDEPPRDWSTYDPKTAPMPDGF